MELPYKTKLGARLLPRDAFLDGCGRLEPSARSGSRPINERELLPAADRLSEGPVVSPPATDDASATSETTTASTDTA